MGGSPTVYGVGLLIGALLSCRGSQPDAGGDDVARIGSDSTGAPVIREASVVAFWLAASDTLGRGEGADLLDDFRAYTQLVSPFLADRGIPLLTTNAESLIVELSGGPRRVIVLAGLDYPFGYVLVEPGYPESILTGVSTEDELLSEVDWYFGLDEEGETPDGRRQVVRLGHGGALPARRARVGPARREKTPPAGIRRLAASGACGGIFSLPREYATAVRPSANTAPPPGSRAWRRCVGQAPGLVSPPSHQRKREEQPRQGDRHTPTGPGVGPCRGGFLLQHSVNVGAGHPEGNEMLAFPTGRNLGP